MSQNLDIRVVLDEDATILDFECNLLNAESYEKEEVIGKNWFDVFIEDVDRDKVMIVFNEIFNKGSNSEWKTFKNDIKCKDGKHYLIDFENYFSNMHGKKVVVSIGRQSL